jgi:hypothetical protein
MPSTRILCSKCRAAAVALSVSRFLAPHPPPLACSVCPARAGCCSWNSAVVLKFDPKPAKDSHGNVGPIHTLKYEDGEFDEVFDDATKFQIAMPRASMQMERTESDLSTADTHASLGRGRARGAVGAGASGGSAGGGSRAKNGDTPRRRDSASKRVKTEVFSHRVQTPAAYDYAPQHALPLPQTESDGMGYLGSYNSRDQDLDNGHVDEGADCKRPRERKLSARMREAAKFSKVLYLVTLYSDFNRALIFREFLSGAGSNG